MKFKDLKKIINKIDEKEFGERKIYIQTDPEGNDYYELSGLDFNAFYDGEGIITQEDIDECGYEEGEVTPCGVLY